MLFRVKNRDSFCYSGSNRKTLHNLLAPANLDLWAVELPGRGDRFGEKPYRRVDILVDVLAPQLRNCSTGAMGFSDTAWGPWWRLSLPANCIG